MPLLLGVHASRVPLAASCTSPRIFRPPEGERRSVGGHCRPGRKRNSQSERLHLDLALASTILHSGWLNPNGGSTYQPSGCDGPPLARPVRTVATLGKSPSESRQP